MRASSSSVSWRGAHPFCAGDETLTPRERFAELGGFSKVKMVRKVGTEHIYALKSTNIHRAFDEGQVAHMLEANRAEIEAAAAWRVAGRSNGSGCGESGAR